VKLSSLFGQATLSSDIDYIREIYTIIEKADYPKVSKSIYLSSLEKKINQLSIPSNGSSLNLSDFVTTKSLPTSKSEQIAIGQSILGPILHAFYSKLIARLQLASNEDSKPQNIYFLAREGYLLQKGFDLLKESGYIVQDRYQSVYLLASRSLLCKLCMQDKNMISLIQRHAFNGNIQEFMNKRLKIADYLIDQILAGSNMNPSTNASKSNLLKLSEYISNESIFEQSRKDYLAYLASIGFFEQNPSLIVDIGYSGTIQDLMSGLTGHKTIAYYFMTTKSAYSSKNIEIQKHGLIFSGAEWGKTYYLLDKSLIIESLLTSPTGSCIGVVNKDSKFVFQFGQKTNTQIRFAEIESIFNYAMQYVIKMLEIGKHPLDAFEMNDLFDSIVTSGLLKKTSISSLLEIEDEYCGNDVFSIAEVF